MSSRRVMKHYIRWFVWAGDRIRHSRTMRGLWGYDVECTCGWSTSAEPWVARAHIKQRVWEHKWEASHTAEVTDE